MTDPGGRLSELPPSSREPDDGAALKGVIERRGLGRRGHSPLLSPDGAHLVYEGWVPDLEYLVDLALMTSPQRVPIE